LPKSSATPKPDFPQFLFATPEVWAAWLEEHHATDPGVWLQLAKKGSGIQSVTYLEAVEVALCYGWIDGQSKAVDDKVYVQKFTPRGANSIWSKINREKAEALIAAGKMQPAGLRAIERARQNGRWDAAYASASTATVPEDFQAALDQNAAAKAFFATLNSANRYAFLFRLHNIRTPATRAKRIAQYVEMLERQEKLYP
jgi:uncharacterized protein YdeI (YjbR/CyaY-like superfamily)